LARAIILGQQCISLAWQNSVQDMELSAWNHASLAWVLEAPSVKVSSAKWKEPALAEPFLMRDWKVIVPVPDGGARKRTTEE
jgi:hypothetical protein